MNNTNFEYTNANINSMRTFCAEVNGERIDRSRNETIEATKTNLIAINNHITRHHAKPCVATSYVLHHEWNCILCYLGIKLTDQIIEDVETNDNQRLDDLKSYIEEHRQAQAENARTMSMMR